MFNIHVLVVRWYEQGLKCLKAAGRDRAALLEAVLELELGGKHNKIPRTHEKDHLKKSTFK